MVVVNHGTYCGWKSWLIGLFLFPCICCCKSIGLKCKFIITTTFLLVGDKQSNLLIFTNRSDRYLLKLVAECQSICNIRVALATHRYDSLSNETNLCQRL